MLGSVQRVTSQKEQVNGILSAESFAAALTLEKKRTERSGNPFLLALFNLPQRNGNSAASDFNTIVQAIRPVIRDTDVVGWYQQNSVLAVVFTQWRGETKLEARTAVDARLHAVLARTMPPDRLQNLQISYQFFPTNIGEPTSEDNSTGPVAGVRRGSQGARFLKRTLDVVGSLLAMPFLIPLFVVIGILIKVNSRGPILFRQTRIGKGGKTFTFLKFRSMYDKNDPSIHREYVTRLIRGQNVAQIDRGKSNVFKIVEDPRITSVGRFLRKSSLDEVPQFINVLMGDMSLVGPRPPVPYEFEHYEPWHRQRVMEMKPGITGLWQVSGRSKATFDEMVRLDLQYARTWSIWLDIKILLRTPAAVLSGEGAY